VGGKKQPSYRIVVAESTAPRDGKFVEVIGFYNPRTEPETVQLKEERALHWLGVGAQPTDAVARMLKNAGTIERLARLRAGEALDVLVAEAEAAAAQRVISPKTNPVRREQSEPQVEEEEA